jgi:hypothetical protein
MIALIAKALFSKLGCTIAGASAVFLAALLIGAKLEIGHLKSQAAQMRAQVAEADARASKRAQAVTTAQAAVTSQVETKAATTLQRERVVTRTITERIPIYVPVEADARCIVPVGFVRVHDAAAVGDLSAVPESAGVADGGPSGLALSDVAEAVADNYGSARQNAGQLKALQDWIRQVAAVSATTP